MFIPADRAYRIGMVRIAFGVIWAIDAQFKWRPAFIDGLASYLSGAMEGQPHLVQDWIHFWVDVVNVNPTAFAYFVAIAEAALAIALILGLFSNLAYLGGTVMALVIWSTAEGFGGPYVAGSTDIGAAIIYVFVFALLYLTQAGQHLGLDRWLGGMLGRWAFLASGPSQPQADRPSGPATAEVAGGVQSTGRPARGGGRASALRHDGQREQMG